MINMEAPYEDSFGLWYDSERNIFIDDGGWEVTWLFSIITPNQLFLFKLKKEDMVVRGVTGDIIELYYPLEDDQDDELHYNDSQQ